jgi:hypothetical protein
MAFILMRFLQASFLIIVSGEALHSIAASAKKTVEARSFPRQLASLTTSEYVKVVVLPVSADIDIEDTDRRRVPIPNEVIMDVDES